jgi:hypothetical protein
MKTSSFSLGHLISLRSLTFSFPRGDSLSGKLGAARNVEEASRLQ